MRRLSVEVEEQLLADLRAMAIEGLRTEFHGARRALMAYIESEQQGRG